MLRRSLVSILGCAWCLTGGAVPAVAQDPVKVDPNVKVEFENARVRILRMTYQAGVNGPLHTHDLPRVIVELADSRQRADDGTVNERKRNTARFSEPNTAPHKAAYLTAAESIAIELKGAAGTPVPIPPANATVVDPGHHSVEFENARVRIVRMTYPTGYKTPMHSHLPGVTIVLSATSVHSWASDNKESDATTTAKSASWSEGGETHANEVRGTTPLELIRVELKTR